MKPGVRDLAIARMEILIGHAVRNARSDPELSERQALLARRISTRHKVRMPYRLRMAFCRRCKSFMVPGVGSRIRLGRASVRSIRITCNRCGHTHRKIISP